MPGPVSATLTSHRAPRRTAVTVTVPPGGVNRAALSSKLNRTWCSRSRSAHTAGTSGAISSRTDTPSDEPMWSSDTTCETRGPTETAERSNGTSPDSSRDRSRSCSTRRDSRSDREQLPPQAAQEPQRRRQPSQERCAGGGPDRVHGPQIRVPPDQRDGGVVQPRRRSLMDLAVQEPRRRDGEPSPFECASAVQ